MRLNCFVTATASLVPWCGSLLAAINDWMQTLYFLQLRLKWISTSVIFHAIFCTSKKCVYLRRFFHLSLGGARAREGGREKKTRGEWIRKYKAFDTSHTHVHTEEAPCRHFSLMINEPTCLSPFQRAPPLPPQGGSTFLPIPPHPSPRTSFAALSLFLLWTKFCPFKCKK